MADKRRILLVEDQQILCQLMSFELAEEGHEVTFAGDGVQAMALLEKVSFDIVVTDLYMPEMGGIELIKTMQTKNIELPIIVLSASRQGDVATELTSLGVEHFIDKPITDDK
ncbi:MAG: response regulator, partial [Psychrosphaera sp.]|nr:response regulator [Psychrosphaera sp.]